MSRTVRLTGGLLRRITGVLWLRSAALLVAIGGIAIILNARRFADDLLKSVIALAVIGPFALGGAGLIGAALDSHPVAATFVGLVASAIVLGARHGHGGKDGHQAKAC